MGRHLERVWVHHAVVSSSDTGGTAATDGDDFEEGRTEVVRREQHVLICSVGEGPWVTQACVHVIRTFSCSPTLAMLDHCSISHKGKSTRIVGESSDWTLNETRRNCVVVKVVHTGSVTACVFRGVTCELPRPGCLNRRKDCRRSLREGRLRGSLDILQ